MMEATKKLEEERGEEWGVNKKNGKTKEGHIRDHVSLIWGQSKAKGKKEWGLLRTVHMGKKKGHDSYKFPFFHSSPPYPKFPISSHYLILHLLLFSHIYNMHLRWCKIGIIVDVIFTSIYVMCIQLN